VIAHVGAVPLEEILPSVTGAGASLLLVRAWLMAHLRRRREERLCSDEYRWTNTDD
jgi:hypothetical protein